MMEFCATLEVETPSVPQNLSANTIDARSISLSWTSAKNATSYNVYLGTEKLANVTTTYYLAEGLEPNTEYCFTIAAVNSNYESEKSAEACAKTLDNVGLEEISSSINIYPNPVKDKLYIETDVEIEDVVVYDVFGRQQDNKTTQQQDNVTIDVSKLDAGVYFVKIKTAEGENVKRIIKRN